MMPATEDYVEAKGLLGFYQVDSFVPTSRKR